MGQALFRFWELSDEQDVSLAFMSLRSREQNRSEYDVE